MLACPAKQDCHLRPYVLCCAVLCCAVLCCAVLCCAVLCSCVGGHKVNGLECSFFKLLTLLVKLFECVVLTVNMMHFLQAKVKHFPVSQCCRALTAVWSLLALHAHLSSVQALEAACFHPGPYLSHAVEACADQHMSAASAAQHCSSHTAICSAGSQHSADMVSLLAW